MILYANVNYLAKSDLELVQFNNVQIVKVQTSGFICQSKH